MPHNEIQKYKEYSAAIVASEEIRYSSLDVDAAIHQQCDTCGLPMRVNWEGNFCIPCTLAASGEVFQRFLDLARTRQLKLLPRFHAKSAYCANRDTFVIVNLTVQETKVDTELLKLCPCWVHQLMRWESMPQFLSGQGSEDD